MYDLFDFEQRANEKRAAIGKPPVGSYDVPRQRSTVIGREFSDIRRAEFKIKDALNFIARFVERASQSTEGGGDDK